MFLIANIAFAQVNKICKSDNVADVAVFFNEKTSYSPDYTFVLR